MDSLELGLNVQLPFYLQVAIITFVVLLVYRLWFKSGPILDFPVASVEGLSPRDSWINASDRLIKAGLAKYSKPFQVITGTGPKIVLQNRYANELRSHPDLNSQKAFTHDFFINYPGFEAFKVGVMYGNFLTETVRVKLTQSLNLITNDLVEETTLALHDVLGESKEWHTIRMKDNLLDMVARTSARVFLGLPLCRDKRWLEISKNYVIDSFIGCYILRATPAITRPFVYWLIPQMKRVRKAVKDAHRLIDPEAERRKARVDKALAAGEKPPKVADALGWMHEVARGRDIDIVAGQLTLSLAALHTTTEITSAALYHLCQFPEVVDRLRDEIIQVIGEHGWSKTTLYKLKFMDSFLKESQRFNPFLRTSMSRWVEREITLSDGTILPKDTRLMVAANFMDPEIYPEPEKFDATRFLRKREESGQDGAWQLVATSPEHFLFGHGEHACPGRFFAVNEIKILLCHLLMKYDWKFIGDKQPEWDHRDTGDTINPGIELSIRRRESEINIDI